MHPAIRHGDVVTLAPVGPAPIAPGDVVAIRTGRRLLVFLASLVLPVLAGFIAVAASHGLGYFRRWLRNPMSVGIGLWAFGHLLANGKKADVIFFGTFLAVALAELLTGDLLHAVEGE